VPQRIEKPVTRETYHVFNRGVDKRNVFLDKYDYVRFYQTLDYFNSINPIINLRLSKSVRDKKPLVEIVAYSFLPNHYHLILRQLEDGGISEFMRRIGTGYTSYFNEKYSRSGALFQGVFKRVHVSSEEQLQYLFAYVNENHTVHGSSQQREVIHTSSVHYQGIFKSRLIKKTPEHQNYNYELNQATAKHIFEKRTLAQQKQFFFE
jgi:REP element-mobilizing transposase RayT